MAHGATIPGLFVPAAPWNISIAGFYARLLVSPTAVRHASVATILALLAGAVAVGGRTARGEPRALHGLCPDERRVR
jgi:hypothetical protein